MAERAAERIRLEREWHGRHDKEGALSSTDFKPSAATKKGIEDQGRTQITVDYRPLPKEELEDC
eukprot:5673010-Lingulodinium_polyedra.AAC.1